jgi:hypothetical protein
VPIEGLGLAGRAVASGVVEAGIRGMGRPCIRADAVARARAVMMGVTAVGLGLVARDRLGVIVQMRNGSARHRSAEDTAPRPYF